MITIDGAFGQGTSWVSWVPSRQNASSVLPGGMPAYISLSPIWSPVIPCSMFLPPATGGILYHTDYTPYGGRVGKIDIGAINSYCGDHHYPLPCTQSTVTGTITPLGADGNSFALHRQNDSSSPWTGPYYHDNGNEVSFLGGRTTDKNEEQGFDHKGKLRCLPIRMENTFYWYDRNWLLMSHVPPDASSPAYPNEHAEHAQWLWSINSPLTGDNKPHHLQRSEWTHTSANVWTETYWAEYHQNASYVPEKPLGYSGVPYVVCQAKVVRVHTLKFIRQDPVAQFSLFFDIVEDVEYYESNGGSEPLQGTLHCTYANVVWAEVLSPGLSEGRGAALSGLDDYCRLAAGRAVHLYDEKLMGVARSAAMSDVSALASNWIENISSVGGYADMFDPLIEGWASVKNNDLAAATKALASAFLVYKYCYAPTVADAYDLENNLESQIQASIAPVLSNERRRGRFFQNLTLGDRDALAGYFATYHLTLKDKSFAKVLNALSRLGLDPSGSHGWDLIPFSFVLDWFVSIGPALEKISAYNNARLTRELKVRIQTFKVVWPLSTTELLRYIPYNWKVAGPLVYSWYDRRVAQRWGTFDPFAGQTNDGLSMSQMTQGAALLLAILL